MPHITPGNRLYFYQLLSQELGIGRQVPLPTVERLFAVHDLDPEDVDCSSVRDVLVALGDFVRLTVFKRGRVYVTLLADETYDGILSRQASEGEPRSAGGTKTWRHRRGAKDPRPAKPRHRHARQRGAQPLTTPDATPAAMPAEARERAPRPRDRGPETAQEVTQEPASIAGSEQGPRQTVRPHPIGVTVAEGARPSDAPIGAADRMQQDLPQDFPHEVFCKDEPLSLLYQLLPVGVDPMAELDEDWRLARATGSFEGTRSSISFVLHQRTEQGDAITAHLRRSARGRAGKHWTLEAVVAPSHGHTIIHRLERELARHAVIGSWDAYLGELAALAVPEDWSLPGDPETGSLAGLRAYLVLTVHRLRQQAKIVIGHDDGVMAFDTGLLDAGARPVYDVLIAHDGDIPWQHAGFCTTQTGSAAPLLARLGRLPRAATYLSSLDDVALHADVPLEAPAELDARLLVATLNRARTDYRLVAPAWEPTCDEVRLLLPLWDADGTLQRIPALRLEGEGDDARYVCSGCPTLREAWACARAVCPERPAWLAGARQA